MNAINQLERNQLEDQFKQRCIETNTRLCRFDKDLGVVYTDEVRYDRKPNSSQTEELVRGLILLHLVEDLNYSVDDINLEQSVEAKVGKSNEKAKYVDLVLTDSLKPFYMMEIKVPSAFENEHRTAWEGQLFGLSKFFEIPPQYLVYATYDLDSKLPVYEIVSTNDYRSFKNWEKDGSRVKDALVPKFGQPKIELFFRNTNGKKDLKKNVQQNEINRLRTSLNNVLWGGGSQSDTDIFNLLVRLLLAKVHDEFNTPAGKPYQFQFGISSSRESDIDRIEKLYLEALKSRLKLDVQDTLRDKRKGTNAQFEFAIAKLSQYNFSEIVKSPEGADLIGSFFEQVMRNGFKQTKGQYFTHHNIISFMVDVAGVSALTRDRLKNGADAPTMIDPSSGSGAFVIQCMKSIFDTAKSIDLTEASTETQQRVHEITEGVKVNAWASSKCVGLEINAELGLAAQVNMIMHGDGSSAMFSGAEFGDGLTKFSEYPQTCTLLNTHPPPPYPTSFQLARISTLY